jgi:hypothetical protein
VNKWIAVFGLLAATNCTASIISYIGTLASPEDYFQTTATLSVPGTLTLQTYGFGGGTNGNGASIASGGFDPLVAVFDNTGGLIDGTSDVLTNYTSFAGCPPAGLINIGAIKNQCGDIELSLSLGTGTYTIILSDGAYIPYALFGGGNLSDGFADLTGGFTPLQTCADEVNCNNDTNAWALDVTTPGGTSAPEPGAMGIAGIGLLSMALAARYRFHFNGGSKT